MDYAFIEEEKPEYRVSDREIEEIEERLHLKFPAVLRNYYLEHNGASIYWCFPVFADGYDRDVMSIKALKYASVPVEWTREMFVEDGFIDADLVPFAENGGGDCYFWSRKTGKVYIIYMDDVENPDYLCESVESFFEILCNSKHEE